MTHVQGKTVLITGASSGLGEATALLLAEKGARLVLGARREDKLRDLVDRIHGKGGQAVYHVTDVTKRDDLEELTDLAIRQYEKIDVLFNNAGVGPFAPMEMTRVEEWDMMLDVNIRGVLYAISSVLPVMKKQGYGHIINTASIAGHHVFPNATVYCATKHAVLAISEGLRLENDDLRVTSISPGAVTTEFIQHTAVDEIRERVQDSFAETALKPEDIAEAVLYAIQQPPHVDVNEVVVRPKTQAL